MVLFELRKCPGVGQHATAAQCTGGRVTPTAPGKLAECADADINTHTDCCPPGLPASFSSYKVKSIPFTAKGEGWDPSAEAEKHLVQIKTVYSGPLPSLRPFLPGI